MEEYRTTGDIAVAKLAEKDKDVIALRTFMGIYGIGPAKAMKLIEENIRTIQ